jgi:hypothetical protein
MRIAIATLREGARLRRLAAAAAAAALAACGSSSTSTSSSPPSGALSGTLLGQPFAPLDATAIAPGQGSCSLGGVTASATGLALRFSSFQGLCSLMTTMTTQDKTCGTRANGTVLTLVLVSARRGGTAPPIQPGTYAITTGIPLPDPQGNIMVAQALGAQTHACADPPGTSFASSGTITLTAVGSTVTGSVDVMFSDGGHVSGSFSAPACSVQTDVCTALGDLTGSCVAQSCIP